MSNTLQLLSGLFIIIVSYKWFWWEEFHNPGSTIQVLTIVATLIGAIAMLTAL